jgi:hypothetical protein
VRESFIRMKSTVQQPAMHMAARNDHKNTIRFQIAGFIVGLITTLMFVSSMMCG